MKFKKHAGSQVLNNCNICNSIIFHMPLTPAIISWYVDAAVGNNAHRAGIAPT